MKEGKKKFGETGVGRFLKEKGPGILAKVGDALVPGNIISSLLDLDPDMTAEDKAEARRLLQEYELEVFRLENEDRASARLREVELAKTGKKDFMMWVTGLIVLALLVTTVLAIFFIDLANKDMAHFIAGEIIGLGSGIVMYYYGTSHSSSEKTKLLTNISDGKRP
ncbi:MAG: hypothetical protein RIE86_09150 [Imperialibacter sp.]|uniref:hypothetical protein n=1 Tax=Imperialibacter sp. TaxID=2038411 RepID=UPI0032ED405E